jgi:hypothetical protein
VIFLENPSPAGSLQGARGWTPPRFISQYSSRRDSGQEPHYIETPKSPLVSWKPI